jgi:hypothetical protein
LEPSLAFFVALVARDSMSLSELSEKPDFASTLFNILASHTHENDLLSILSAGVNDVALKRMGISKTEKASVRFSSILIFLAGCIPNL